MNIVYVFLERYGPRLWPSYTIARCKHTPIAAVYGFMWRGEYTHRTRIKWKKNRSVGASAHSDREAGPIMLSLSRHLTNLHIVYSSVFHSWIWNEVLEMHWRRWKRRPKNQNRIHNNTDWKKSNRHGRDETNTVRCIASRNQSMSVASPPFGCLASGFWDFGFDFLYSNDCLTIPMFQWSCARFCWVRFGSGPQRVCVTFSHHLLVIYSLYPCPFVRPFNFHCSGQQCEAGKWGEWTQKKIWLLLWRWWMIEPVSIEMKQCAHWLSTHFTIPFHSLLFSSFRLLCSFLIYVTLFKQLIRMERECCCRCVVRTPDICGLRSKWMNGNESGACMWEVSAKRSTEWDGKE